VITEQRERWLAAGSPPVPTLVVDGTPHVLQHPSQAWALLGKPGLPPPGDALEVAWDVDEIVGVWLKLLEETPWDALLDPLPRLARTPLDLGVDTLVGIAALTEACATGWFHWPGNPATGATGDAAVGEYQDSIVATIQSRDDLLAFAWPVARAWRQALGDYDEALRAEPGRTIGAPRGDIAWARLLEAQRLHAAQHYRQATTFLIACDVPVPPLDFAALHGLELPQFVY
jgi:hypothetical protein